MSQKTFKKTDKSCCDVLSILLVNIERGMHIQYGTMNLFDADGFGARTHVLSCKDMDGSDIMFSNRSIIDDKICQNCTLQLYIKSQCYNNIWKLRLNDKYYFQLTGLMDMVGPAMNYLIFKKIVCNKTLFTNYYRFQCYRLLNCAANIEKPKLSCYVQRLKGIRGLCDLLRMSVAMRKTRKSTKKWIGKDKTNRKYINKILTLYFNDSYKKKLKAPDGFDNLESDDEIKEEYDQLIDFIMCKYSKYLNKSMVIKYNKIRVSDIDIDILKQLKKEIGFDKIIKLYYKENNVSSQFKRFCKNKLIKCGNKNCATKSYSKYKYGIDDDYYVNNNDESKNIVINKWKICKGCKFVYYCSRNCQKIDWTNHRQFCLQN